MGMRSLYPFACCEAGVSETVGNPSNFGRGLVRWASLLAVTSLAACSGNVSGKGEGSGSDSGGAQGEPGNPSDPANPATPGSPNQNPGAPPVALMPEPGPASLPPVGDLWSDPKTWGGKLPAAGDSVTIPAGRTILVDVDPAALKSLTVRGALVFQERDVQLRTNTISVERGGRFQLGTVEKPFEKRATITLDGPTATTPGFGGKTFSVVDGILDIHGTKTAHSWTKLGAEVAPGATQIVLAEAPGWRVGDRVVIATSSTRMDDYDAAEIAAIDGKTVTLKAPLKFKHFGTVRMVGDEKVDVRAEVGLINRNIVIAGDEASVAQQVGVHMMFMASQDTTIRLSNIEVTRAGQFNRLGRYPVHFHIMKDQCKGCFVRDLSVHDTIQRGIVVHDTSNILFEGNVVYKTVGHNFIVETMSTPGNAFRHNLALVNTMPSPKFTNADLLAQNDDIPGGFWIKNARNEFSDNASAGSVGIGFFFDATSEGPLLFQRNTVHAAMSKGAPRDFIIQSGFLLMCGQEDADKLKQGSKVTDVLLYQNGLSGFWPEKCTTFSKGMSPFEISRIQMIDNLVVNMQLRGQQDFFEIKDSLFTETLLDPTNRAGALHFQYGATVTLTRPTFAHMQSAVYGSNDILGPWIARLRVEGARFIQADKSAIARPAGSDALLEALDDSFMPKGSYTTVEGSKPTLAVPGCTTKAGGDGNVIYCPTTPVLGALMVNQSLSKGEDNFSQGTPMHTVTALAREDGGMFPPRSYGFGGYEIAAGTDLVYRLGVAPQGRYSVHFAPMGSVSKGLDDTSYVDVAIPAAKAPAAVYRLDADESANISLPKPADTLKPASSVAELKSNPMTHYFFDSSSGALRLKANYRHIVVEQ